MKIIAFLNALAMVDRIIDQLKPAFVAAKSPPPHTVYQELLMASETADEYFSQSSLALGGEARWISDALCLVRRFPGRSPRSGAQFDV